MLCVASVAAHGLAASAPPPYRAPRLPHPTVAPIAEGRSETVCGLTTYLCRLTTYSLMRLRLGARAAGRGKRLEVGGEAEPCAARDEPAFLRGTVRCV